MPTISQVQVIAARCVSAMACYHIGERSMLTRYRMVAQIEYLAAWAVEDLQVSHRGTDSIVEVVRSELLARYGNDDGCRLTDEFTEVFHRAVRTLAPPIRRSKLASFSVN